MVYSAQEFYDSIKNAKNNIDTNRTIQAIYKYVIYFSFFDILGKYVFPKEKSLCERYKKLINCYSNWKYKNYISSLQLECILKQVNENLREIIKLKINKKSLTYNNYFNKVVTADEVDFTEEEIKEDLNNSQLELYKKDLKIICQARYDNLFYKLRCFVVHNLTLPTPNALNFDENSEVPLYFCFSNEYRLWFSPKIISLVLEECIENSKKDITHNLEDIFELIPKCWIGKKN